EAIVDAIVVAIQPRLRFVAQAIAVAIGVQIVGNAVAVRIVEPFGSGGDGVAVVVVVQMVGRVVAVAIGVVIFEAIGNAVAVTVAGALIAIRQAVAVAVGV